MTSPTASQQAIPGAEALVDLEPDRLLAIPNAKGVDLATFLHELDWSAFDANVAQALAQRAELREGFPLEGLSSLELERYALNGPADFHDAFSYALEFGADQMGSIRGGSSFKFGIFKGNEGDWKWSPKLAVSTAEEAWTEIRRGYVKMLDDIAGGRWDSAESWNRQVVWPAVRLKITNIYYPDEIVPIYSRHALRHYLGRFGMRDVQRHAQDAFLLNRTLLSIIKATPELADRDLLSVMFALYAWDDPRADGVGRKRGTPKPGTAIDSTVISITGDETLEELVDIWRAEAEYPTRHDELSKERLAEFRESLGIDRINEATPEDLRLVWSPRSDNYGSPGPMSVLNTTLRDATEAELQRVRSNIGYLMYDEADVVQRLEAVLEGSRQIHGLGDSVAMKFLALAEPTRFLPVYPYSGDKGKRAVLDTLPISFDANALDRADRAERLISSNDIIVEALTPHVSDDPWEISRFIWWTHGQFAALRAFLEAPDEPVVEIATKTSSSAADESTAITFDELVERTLLDRTLLREIVDVLSADQLPHVILAGPPGTSKTFVADLVAQHLTHASNVTTVQLHPSYGYEEFVEGLRPTTDDNGQLVFKPEEGPLLRAADAAAADPESLQLLVIDEMNRANLPRVFGELLFLLEYRDRPIDLRFHPGFVLPPNLALLGTMNTADRSIRSIDAAIRRRFAIFECMPNERVLEQWYASGRASCDVPDLVAGFVNLNVRLTDLLDRHHTVGHSFLMRPRMTRDELARIWSRRIGPLVEEYLFDRPESAREITLESCWPSMSKA